MTLKSVHPSVMKVRTDRMERARPRNMEMIAVSQDDRQFIEQFTLDIFTDMINAGCTFQAALTAIYVSGAKHMAQAIDH